MANPLDHVTAGPPATSPNGHVGADTPLDAPPARPPGPSARPAAVVLGIIFVLFVLGAVLAGLASGPSTSKPSHPSSGPIPGTGGLVAVPARSVLTSVLAASEPPADVVAAVVVPRGTAAVPSSGVQRGVGLYDASVRAEVPAAEQPVITFFRAELAAGHWHVLQAGDRSGGGYQFLAQHPGSDGYEWEIGVTLSATEFTDRSTVVSVPPSGLTPVTLRLFAVSDQS